MIGLFSFILLITLGIYAVTLLVDPNKFKSNIESTSASAGIKLGIEGDLAWQLFPFGLSVDKVNFVLSDRSMSGSADQLSLGVNFSTLISLASQRSQLPISRLTVTNGRMLYALPNSLPLQFSQINFAIDDLNSIGEIFTLALDLVAPKGVKVSVNADIAMRLSEQTLTDLSIANFQLNINRLSISGHLETANHLKKIQGQFKADSFNLIEQFKLAKRFEPDLIVPRMADPKALTNITLDSFFDIETEGYSKIQTTLSIDGQPMDIDVDIDHPNYKLHTVVSGKKFNLDAYKAQSNNQSNHSMLFAPLAIPMAVWHGQSQFELNLMAIKIAGIDLSDIYINLFGNQNIFRLTSLSGDIFGGQLNASGSLNMQHAKPTFAFESTITGVDLNTVTQSMDDINIGGLFSLETSIQGSGDSAESMLESLDGSGNINIASPSYQGTNLEQTLCNAAAMFGGKPIPKTTWSDNTELADFSGMLRLKKDRLLLTEYQTNLSNIAIYGNADLNLRTLRYSLNTTALATQPTSSANGCKISPMLVKREIPLRCKGTLGDKFNCKPDNNLIQTLLLSPK
jgi:uncharacterized protein involved in outer membrane biogenesis